MRRILLAFLLLTAGAASAESPVIEAGRLRITVTAAECAALARHVPAPDVVYRPGIDVDGRPIVPADPPGSPRIVFPETYEIPITVDLSERIGVPADPSRFDADVQVGTVTLQGDRLFFNGMPLSPQDEAAIVRACVEAGL